MIVLIAALSVGIAYFLASSLLGGVSQQSTKVKTIESITGTVEKPDTKIFNENAINPSVEVNINNTEPEAQVAPVTNTTVTPVNDDSDTSDNDASSNTP